MQHKSWPAAMHDLAHSPLNDCIRTANVYTRQTCTAYEIKFDSCEIRALLAFASNLGYDADMLPNNPRLARCGQHGSAHEDGMTVRLHA